ncbi:hypothetical protein AMTR_s00053p00173300, partial [Amborella trichopoda]
MVAIAGAFSVPPPLPSDVLVLSAREDDRTVVMNHMPAQELVVAVPIDLLRPIEKKPSSLLMAAQRVTLLDSLDVEVALSAPTSMRAIPKGTVRMSLLDWEKGNSWDHLTMKIASILALEEHRSKALFMARIPFTPLLL